MRFSEVFKESLEVFGKHWRLLVSAALLISILPAALMSGAYLTYYNGLPPEQFTSWDIIMGIVGWVLSLLLALSVLEFLRARNRNLAHSVRAGAGRFWDGLILTVIMSVALLFLFLLLIIPGIIFSVYWAFAYYALVMDGKGIIGSLKHSTSVVRGNWWRVLGYLVLITIILLAASLVVLIPTFLLGFGLAFLSPLLGGFLAMVISVSLDALMLVYLLIFMERMYVALR